MATVESISFQPWREFFISPGQGMDWAHDSVVAPTERLPQVYWDNGEGWREANLWAFDKVYNDKCDVETARALMKHLRTYASFLEQNNLEWRHFPVSRSERAVFRFRGELIKKMLAGELAGSTARARMSAVIQFYRYAAANQLIHPDNPMWREHPVVIRYFDDRGFKRAITKLSSDLAIRHRSSLGIRLEDGLLPLSESHMSALLKYTATSESIELHLMLCIGFFVGARLETITTLRIENLERAKPDPYMSGFFLIRVGPGTDTATKLDVAGELLVPDVILATLKLYAYSEKRLKREIKANKNDKSLLFITTRGNRYRNTSVGTLMTFLRRKAICSGLQFMDNFKFHQTRATYGTWLMSISLGVTNAASAIAFVKSAMLHKNESTTFMYIKFLESTKAKQEAAQAFHEAFTGLYDRKWSDCRS